MTARRTQWKLGLLCGAIAIAAGCSGEELNEGCKSNADCGTGLFCDSGVCACRTDDACGLGQYCNAYGNCQDRPPCLGNQDCDQGYICNSADTTGGACIPENRCGSSVHCPINQYCEFNAGEDIGSCQTGCRSTGDCQLGWICQAGQCQPGATGGDCHTCPIDPPGPDASYCEYGEMCGNNGQCQEAPNAAYFCRSCDSFTPCGASNLVCLIDNESTSNENYCAPTCATDLDCPSGYGDCGGLIIIPGQCQSDPDCTNGGRCIPLPESTTGFCECVGAQDCPTGNCISGRCQRAPGVPCQIHADCATSCVKQGPEPDAVSVCETNVRVCGKEQGLTCSELTNTSGICAQL